MIHDIVLGEGIARRSHRQHGFGALTAEGQDLRLEGGDVMQRLFTHIRNSDYQACDDGADYLQAEVALAQGVRSAAALIVDEIGRGRTSAAIEVSIEQEDGTQLFCSVVAVSISPLILRTQTPARPLPVTGAPNTLA